MKNIKKIMLLKFSFFASIFLLASCSNDDGGNGSAPVITSISKSVVDDPLVEGDREVDVLTDEVNAGNTYIIRGSGFSTLKSISFNGLESYFNSTFVTDNAIVISVDKDTPYYNEMDELKMVTKGGTLVYSVKVRPPSPSITGFPINPNPGDVITIKGDFFLRPVVNFGTTRVEPIESTLTEIKVKVPNENLQYKRLSISNVSGTTVAGQSFGSAIYDDAFTSLCSTPPFALWDATNPFNAAYDKDPKQGSKCILWTAKQWNGLEVKIASANVDMSKYKGIRVTLKGQNAGKVGVFLNGSDAIKPSYEFSSDWTYVEIPFNAFNNPSELNQISFQEFGGKAGGNTIYIDDLGLILK
jgi:hypothetical protein